DQSGADEVVGVGAVGVGAGGAAGGAAGFARHPQHPARFLGGGVVVQDLAGERVEVGDAAAQVHRLGASSGGVGAAGPGAEVGAVVAGGHVAGRHRADQWSRGRVGHDGRVSSSVGE